MIEESANFYKHRLSLVDELQSIGCGPKELKVLWHTIIEISNANNISKEDAVKKFFNDIEKHYDDTLELESRKHKLQMEVKDLDQQKFKLFFDLNAFPKFGAPIAKLLGVSNNSPEQFSLLVDKVYMVGGISAAIEKLDAHPMLIAAGKSPVLPSNNYDDQTEKSMTRKLAGPSINNQRNSSTDESLNNKTAADHGEQNDVNIKTGIEKEKQVSIEQDDPEFKRKINEIIDRLPEALERYKRNEKAKPYAENNNNPIVKR
jgi:hypothetical protein